MTSLSVRFRVDFSDACAIGPGKIALLEAIERTGSLSRGARDLGMSYRRAWLLLESLNTSFRRPVAESSTGGRGGGGARLTPFGIKVVAAYRELDADLSRRAANALAAIAREVAPAASAAPRRRLQRNSSSATPRRPRT